MISTRRDSRHPCSALEINTLPTRASPGRTHLVDAIDMKPIEPLSSHEVLIRGICDVRVCQIEMTGRSPHEKNVVRLQIHLLKDAIAEHAIVGTFDCRQIVLDILIDGHDGSSGICELKLVHVCLCCLSKILSSNCPLLLIRIIKDMAIAPFNKGEVLVVFQDLRSSIETSLIVDVSVDKTEVLAGEDGRSTSTVISYREEDVARVIDKIWLESSDLESWSNDVRGVKGLVGILTKDALVESAQVGEERLICRGEAGVENESRKKRQKRETHDAKLRQARLPPTNESKNSEAKQTRGSRL